MHSCFLLSCTISECYIKLLGINPLKIGIGTCVCNCSRYNNDLGAGYTLIHKQVMTCRRELRTCNARDVVYMYVHNHKNMWKEGGKEERNGENT